MGTHANNEERCDIARPASGARIGPDWPALDSETAALFRAWMRPLFEQATNWNALTETLRTKGFGLAIRDGRLVLTEYDSGARVCTARFLGTSLAEMSARIGRPRILARRDRDAAGEFVTADRGAAAKSPKRPGEAHRSRPTAPQPLRGASLR